jgi:hypothetical protein
MGSPDSSISTRTPTTPIFSWPCQFELARRRVCVGARLGADGYGPDRDLTVTNKSPPTARDQLARTAAHWGWEVIGDPRYALESRHRRAPFTISVIFSTADSVVYATLWLDPPIGTQSPQPRCIAVIDEGYNKHHRVEAWMMQHGHSTTKRCDE